MVQSRENDMPNALKAATWALAAMKWAKLGAILGGIVGFIAGGYLPHRDLNENVELMFIGLAVGAFLGAVILAAIPALFAGWFLFLTMLGQAADAVRGDGQRKE